MGMCYNPVLVCNKPLGSPASVKRVYSAGFHDVAKMIASFHSWHEVCSIRTTETECEHEQCLHLHYK